MSKSDITGLGTAIITPFVEGGQIDFDALARLVDFQIENGVNYIVALGTTAETPTLSPDERMQVVRCIVEKAAGRVPVVMGVGGNNTAELVKTLSTTDFSGISAILSVTPYYNKPSQEGLFRHYRTLSEVSPLPIILYNVPGRTGVNMTAETTLRIARECANVIAVKEASGNLAQIKAVIDGAPEGFSVISGDDAVTSAVIEMGGIGVISVFGNAFPREMAWLVKNVLAGNAEEAGRKMDTDFGRLFNLMFVEGNPAGVKCLLHLKGLIHNVLRLPLTPVGDETYRLIRHELERFVPQS